MTPPRRPPLHGDARTVVSLGIPLGKIFPSDPRGRFGSLLRRARHGDSCVNSCAGDDVVTERKHESSVTDNLLLAIFFLHKSTKKKLPFGSLEESLVSVAYSESEDQRGSRSPRSAWISARTSCTSSGVGFQFPQRGPSASMSRRSDSVIGASWPIGF